MEGQEAEERIVSYVDRDGNDYEWVCGSGGGVRFILHMV